MAIGDNELPLVWKHRSGRKSLVIGATAYQVIGKNSKESSELLVKLREWATQPQFCLPAPVARRRPGDLGQHRHHAPRDAVRPRLRPHDAPHQA